MPNCIFCKIAERSIPSSIVEENERLLAFRDVKPEAPKHILIIPKKHIERITDIDPADASLISDMVLLANKIAHQENIDKTGFRLVINCNDEGGQTVFHLHLHSLGGRVMHWPPG